VALEVGDVDGEDVGLADGARVAVAVAVAESVAVPVAVDEDVAAVGAAEDVARP
jgi:hypothetical protein